MMKKLYNFSLVLLGVCIAFYIHQTYITNSYNIFAWELGDKFKFTFVLVTSSLYYFLYKITKVNVIRRKRVIKRKLDIKR